MAVEASVPQELLERGWVPPHGVIRTSWARRAGGGRWALGCADLASSPQGLRWLPEPPGSPGLALSPGCAGAGGDKYQLDGVRAEGSQDLSPGALGTAVQDEIFAGTGRNSRLSLGLVLLSLVFLNCG